MKRVIKFVTIKKSYKKGNGNMVSLLFQLKRSHLQLLPKYLQLALSEVLIFLFLFFCWLLNLVFLNDVTVDNAYNDINTASIYQDST